MSIRSADASCSLAICKSVRLLGRFEGVSSVHCLTVDASISSSKSLARSRIVAGTESNRWFLLVHKVGTQTSKRKYVTFDSPRLQLFLNFLNAHVQSVPKKRMRALSPLASMTLYLCLFWSDWQWGPKSSRYRDHTVCRSGCLPVHLELPLFA
jgi:hypothetical protein